MFEKIVFKVMLGACGGAVVAMCAALIHMAIQDIREDRAFNNMMESRRKMYEKINDELLDRIKEANVNG